MSIPQGAFFIVSQVTIVNGKKKGGKGKKIIYIFLQLNGRVLDVAGGSTENAAKIVVWSKKDSDNDNQ